MTESFAKPRHVDISMLMEQGFSASEISNLTALRESWSPAAEQAATQLEWRRLQFTRWLYQSGYFTDDGGLKSPSAWSNVKSSYLLLEFLGQIMAYVRGLLTESPLQEQGTLHFDFE